MFDYLKSYLDFKRQSRSELGIGNIQFYNWWNIRREEIWLYKFITERKILNQSSRVLRFISVFGNPSVINHFDNTLNIFYTGENVHTKYHSLYSDNMINNKKCHLSLGFDMYENEKYIRLPLWIMYMFSPNSSVEEIKYRCEQLRYPRIGEKKKFASLIARYDWNGVRTNIYNSLSSLGDIDCPSMLLHNDDSLMNKFNDNKKDYLQQYYFNICPENTNAYGYVTEKLFEAIDSGCIPIYWGSYNRPELDVLNLDSIIMWNYDSKSIYNQVSELVNNKNMLDDFIKQPRLNKYAEEFVLEIFDQLENKLRNLV